MFNMYLHVYITNIVFTFLPQKWFIIFISVCFYSRSVEYKNVLLRWTHAPARANILCVYPCWDMHMVCFVQTDCTHNVMWRLYTVPIWTGYDTFTATKQFFWNIHWQYKLLCNTVVYGWNYKTQHATSI